jgi:4-diphosphocytidyl-2-C-methyl-D-erythritol kinase
MPSLTLFSPAKLNLFLAITGRRADGFHDLVSVVAPVAWGDTLVVDPAGTFSLECNDPAVPLDNSNLILKAAAAFRQKTGWTGGAKFHLQKNIPMGAGLGGGSSNAATALRALNYLAGGPLTPAALAEVSAQVGSDCPLFIWNRPVTMRGRGERVEPLPGHGLAAFEGREVLIFKPAFGISTVWAYGEMAKAAPRHYLPSLEAEAKLSAWLSDPAELESLLYNNMEAPAFTKYPALPILLEQLRTQFGLQPRMSGSGSACFALLAPNSPVAEITREIQSAWGDSAIVVQTRFATNPH